MKTYSAENVNILINYLGGSHYVKGLIEEIVIAMANEKFTAHTGLKGDTTYSENLNENGTITFKCKQDSPSNTLFSRLCKSGQTFSAQVIDSNSSTKSTDGGTDCVIMKMADKTKGPEMVAREWVISVPNLNMEDEIE